MIRVIVVGLGPIGFACARAVQADSSMQLVGLVDTDEAKVGLTLSELGNRSDTSAKGPRVTDHLAAAVSDGADMAVLTTASRFDDIAPMLMELLDHHLAVVSSCEQMLWPWYRHNALANDVNAAAERANRAILGTGVNPGFVMDTLAVTLSLVVRRVTQVRCVRRVDAALRRRPLQAKVGATMTPQQFGQLAQKGQIGHKGLAESVALLAAGLGREVQPDSVVETLEPHLATQPIQSSLGLIEPGSVAGIHNIGRWQGADLKIELDLTMAVGLDDPKDVIELDGPVPLSLSIPGSVPGDSATVAVLINHIQAVHQARPGLRTMLEMPPVGCRGQDA